MFGRGFNSPTLVDPLVYKGAIDCSSNPNYPAADAGHMYKISVAGKIGGASGLVVTANDMIICHTDASAAGTQAAVGANWNVIQGNIDLTSPGPIGETTPSTGRFTVVKWAQGANIASATTTDLSTTTGNYVEITGTTTIASFGTVTAGVTMFLRFTGSLTLTYNATSMILPGARDIVTEAGDRAIFTSLGSGNWVCMEFLKANGRSLGDTIVVSRADSNESIPTFQMRGQTHRCGYARTYTLPAATVGLNGFFRTTAAVAVSLDPASSEVINLDGTALTGGNKVTSDGSTGANIYLECTTAGVWDAYTGTLWIDGGA